MTDFLALFPLGLVAFPDENVNLHIFEPRYKQLIKDCFENDMTFGITPFIEKQMMHIGTEMKLLSIEKEYANGEMDVKTKAIGLYKMEEYYDNAPDKLYSAADITRLSFDTETDHFINQQIISLTQELFEILHISKPIPELNSFFHSYKLGHLVGLNIEQEYELLTIRNEFDRQVYILRHLERLLPIVREMQRLQERAKLNGHFRNIIPPEIK